MVKDVSLRINTATAIDLDNKKARWIHMLFSSICLRTKQRAAVVLLQTYLTKRDRFLKRLTVCVLGLLARVRMFY